ncbi:hypothetical protein [Ligilactobacillus salivarius]|nr:hypothetical protein [Ligilactobacillus salivarius]
MTIDYASEIAEETGGVVKHLYVSDKKLDEYRSNKNATYSKES